MRSSMPFLALTLAAALAPAAHAACDPTQVLEIDVSNMAFNPADAEACVGQTVRWTNNEPLPQEGQRPRRHTVTFDPARAAVAGNVLLPAGVAPFGSAILAPGEAYEHVFTAAGDYKYICIPHEEMGHVGTLRVVE